MHLQVVKAIWVYIKAHNLQDPKNKRKIRPDEKLGKILPNCNMLQMNKHLSKHVFTAGEMPSSSPSSFHAQAVSASKHGVWGSKAVKVARNLALRSYLMARSESLTLYLAWLSCGCCHQPFVSADS